MDQPLLPVDSGTGIYASRFADFTGRTRDPDEVRDPILNREPYVRVTLPELGTIDAKAQRWTDTDVLIHWESRVGSSNAWVPAEWVTRITRAESAWTSPYDDWADGVYLGDS